jgi:hypothetical protein
MVEVNQETINFLLDEYMMARQSQFKARGRDYLHTNIGIARGLEMALVKMGVTNTELDRITQEVYRETFPEGRK